MGAGLLTAAALLQATFLQWVRLGPALPDLILIVLVWFSMELRLSSAVALGIVAAFLKICISGEPFFLGLLTLVGTAGLSHWGVRQLVKEIFWVPLGILAAVCFSTYFVSLLWIHPFQTAGGAVWIFFSHVLLTTFYTLAIAPVVWRWIQKLLTQCGNEPFSESSS